MEITELRWTADEMSLRRFVEKHSRSLPMILLTTCGYMDVDNMNEVSADQIYWIYDVCYQRRVIAKTENMLYVSIPLNYALEFQTLTRKNQPPGPAMRLKDIVDDTVPSGQRIKVAAGRSILFDFCTDGIGECNGELGVLELEDMYTEKYLLAYTASEGKWMPQVIGLPVYLPIKVKVATGLAQTDADEAFRHWKQQQTQLCASFGSQEFTPCKEILLFEEPPSSNYEFINPYKCARSETALQLEDTDDSDSDNGYEKVPDLLPAPRPPKPLKPPKKPASSIPPKKSFENDSRQNTAEHLTAEPCPDRTNVMQKKTTKHPLSCSLSASLTPANQQPSKAAGDDFIYEVVEIRPNRIAETGCETAGPSKHCDDFSSPTSPAQDPTYLYAVATKKQPPPTKPKSVKRKQVAGAPSSANAVCRVNPVKPFVDSDVSSKSHQSSTDGEGKKHLKSIHDVPAELDDLSVDQVAECMELLHLPSLAQAFKSHDVDGKLLVSIVSEQLLITDFNCRLFDAKKVVQFVKNGWRPNE